MIIKGVIGYDLICDICGWVWKCIPKGAVQDESSNISM